ncbi:YfhD family protein [Virgibacillus senegalensis]|uniref:YfhD family protein n=1 Tax=Virgibacillus senegalensis TaxID=1499679 RepID=UPI000AF70B16|nr:YfhD family protein [Virgibacillus senegalensis]
MDDNKQAEKALKNIEKTEEVEFSYELADSEDKEAMERMKQANQRQRNHQSRE